MFLARSYARFEKRKLRAFCIHLRALQICCRTSHIRFGSLELRSGLGHACFNFLAVQLGEDLTDLHLISCVNTKLLHNAAGFGLELNFGDGLHFTGSHDAFCESARSTCPAWSGQSWWCPLEA